MHIGEVVVEVLVERPEDRSLSELIEQPEVPVEAEASS